MTHDAVKETLKRCVSYKHGSRVKSDARKIVQAFPNLYPVVANVGFANGSRSGDVLRLTGTVPTHFRGREYHTPLSIVFFKSYPEVGPFICLTPTDDMIIRPDHNYVLPNGTVDCNSIREFNKKADIMTVVNEIILAFGEHPPLFKKSPNMPPQRSLPPVAPPVATPAYPPPMNPELRQDQDGSKLGSTDENLCRICYDKDIETVLVPCGHQCACLACAQQVKQRSNQCPFCKNRIERIVKVYKT